MPLLSSLPESPIHLLEEWRDGAAPLCVLFVSKNTRLHMTVGFVIKVSDQQVGIECNGTVFWFLHTTATFAMPAHTPTALATFGEEFEGQFTRVLSLEYESGEHCLIFEWLAQKETDATS
jgi:hypothetical protein